MSQKKLNKNDFKSKLSLNTTKLSRKLLKSIQEKSRCGGGTTRLPTSSRCDNGKRGPIHVFEKFDKEEAIKKIPVPKPLKLKQSAKNGRVSKNSINGSH